MSKINVDNLNFEDTSIAFASKSDDELTQAYNLFRIFQSEFLVSLGSRLTEIAFKIGLPISYPVKLTLFDQFCGGETIAICKKPIAKLGEFNVDTILDYGAEAKQDEEELELTARFLISNLQIAKDDPDINIISGKITALIRFELLEKISKGEELSEEEEEEWIKGKNRVFRVSQEAANCEISIYYDAEESWIQPAIDEIIMENMGMFNCEKPIIFNTIQLYRHDRLAFLKELHESAKNQGFVLAVKLVRGAYMEKERRRAKEMGYESPIQKDKAATDKDYDAALEYCIENIETIAICNATHNQESCLHLAKLTTEKDIQLNHPHIFSAQLYGMSDHLSFNLAQFGFNVAKYMPYGPVKEVIPYLIRRAKENSSINGQMGRELALIKKEMIRRELIEE